MWQFILCILLPNAKGQKEVPRTVLHYTCKQLARRKIQFNMPWKNNYCVSSICCANVSNCLIAELSWGNITLKHNHPKSLLFPQACSLSERGTLHHREERLPESTSFWALMITHCTAVKSWNQNENPVADLQIFGILGSRILFYVVMSCEQQVS